MSSTLARVLLLAALKRTISEDTSPRQRMTAKAVMASLGELKPGSTMEVELERCSKLAEFTSIEDARGSLSGLSYQLALDPEHLETRDAACVALVGLAALKQDNEDPGRCEGLQGLGVSYGTGSSEYPPDPALLIPHIALAKVAELEGLSPALAKLCSDVAEGRIPPTSEDLICKMGAALDGTLTGAARDKATGASKSSSSTSKKKRGRPTNTDDHAADRRIYEAWKTGQYKTYKELAREKIMDEKAIRLALHRHRARLNRGTTPP